jgi:tetratricopeptide (TPR) repeat protein
LPKFSRAYAHEEIGKYFRKKDMTPEALEEYRICVETFPGNPRFHGVLGALEYNSGDHEAAFETFRRAYGVDSTYALALEMLAQLYGEKRDFESALIYSRKLAGQPREKARAAIVHAAVAEKLGLTREAIDAYTRAMTKDRTRVDLLERIGALLFVTEDYREAERAFRGALSKKPTTSAQIGLVAALWEPLRRDPARRGTPQAQARLKEALGLIDDLLAQGETGRDLSRWREDIRAALAGR